MASLVFRVRNGRLEAESDLLDKRALTAIARRVFALDVDLDGFARSIAGKRDLARALASGRGRILRAPSLFEDPVKMLLTTNYLALDSWVRQEYRRRYPGPRRATDRAIARRYARYGAHRGLALWLDMTSHWHETAGKA